MLEIKWYLSKNWWILSCLNWNISLFFNITIRMICPFQSQYFINVRFSYFELQRNFQYILIQIMLPLEFLTKEQIHLILLLEKFWLRYKTEELFWNKSKNKNHKWEEKVALLQNFFSWCSKGLFIDSKTRNDFQNNRLNRIFSSKYNRRIVLFFNRKLNF